MLRVCLLPFRLLFSVSSTGEQLEVAISGAKHYLTFTVVSTSGFSRGDRKSVFFKLNGSAPDVLRGIGLNYMIYDGTAEGEPPSPEPSLHYEAPWENSTWTVPARFGIYERVDDEAEDETLYDLWVDEGIPHPRVNGTWDRDRAKAWVRSWTEAMYDMSNFGMVPQNHSEWFEFYPAAKRADAKVLWFNFRVWDCEFH